MNVIVLDPFDRHRYVDLGARVAAAAGRPAHVCRMSRAVGPDGPPYWTLRFSPAPAAVRTRSEPDGLLCAALLTADRFAEADELAVLSADCDHWPTHFRRLAGALQPGLDVFLSFDGDGPSRFVLDPDLTSLLRLTNGLTPGLAWYRSAGLFYESAKQVIRKDARWNGQYTADSLLRELALHDARVGYFGRPWDLAG